MVACSSYLLDEDFDLDDTCSLSSVEEEEAELSFGSLYNLNSQQWSDLMSEDDEVVFRRRNSPRWSCFVPETFERNVKRISIALEDGSLQPGDLTRQQGSVCALKTFNSILSDSQSSTEDNISAIALIEKERKASPSVSKKLKDFAGARVDTFTKNVDFVKEISQEKAQENREALNQKITKTADFVDARKSTLSKNIEFAQETAETLSEAVDKTLNKERSRFSCFVHKRMTIFEQNMTILFTQHDGEISVVAAKQA